MWASCKECFTILVLCEFSDYTFWNKLTHMSLSSRCSRIGRILHILVYIKCILMYKKNKIKRKMKSSLLSKQEQITNKIQQRYIFNYTAHFLSCSLKIWNFSILGYYSQNTSNTRYFGGNRATIDEKAIYRKRKYKKRCRIIFLKKNLFSRKRLIKFTRFTEHVV